MSRPTVADVDLEALVHNLAAVRATVGPDTRVLGVVKADAYGHGAVPVARALERAGIASLGVILASEGVALRQAGVRCPILILGTLFPGDAEAAVAHDLAAMVDSPEAARALDAAAARAGRRATAHLKIDTGMHRLGVPDEEAGAFASQLTGLARVDVEGVYTHFACAEQPDHPSLASQLARFRRAMDAVRAAGLAPRLAHAANSAAAVLQPEGRFDMVRAGLALYGIAPSIPAAIACPTLKPVLSLRTEIARTKRVPAGGGVSYGHTWTAPRASRVAVLPVGYGDGYPRALSGKARVRIEGRLCPVVGRVCMDATMADVTDVPEAEAGTPVRLIEADVVSPLSAAGLADLAGTIPYEILTGLSKRVPRHYTGGSEL